MDEKELSIKLDIACSLLAIAIRKNCTPQSVQVAKAWKEWAKRSTRR